MKKDYSEPKAEKVDFNYQETVTASGISGDPTIDDPDDDLQELRLQGYVHRTESGR